MIGIGVIGAGVMGSSHVATLAGLGGARVVGVTDPDHARAARSAAQAPEARLFDDADALIADGEVDAVLVVSPDDHHTAQVLKALDLGKPVLCEKPLATTIEDARAILRADAGRDLVQVGYMRRFDPAYVDFKAHLDSGVIGELLFMRMIHRNAAAPAFMSGNDGITNSLVHEFDILRWLTCQEVARIRVDAPHASRAGKLIDPVFATVETDGGVLLHLEQAGNVRYGYEVRTEALGTEGALEMAAPTATRRLTADGERAAHPADFTQRFHDAYREEFIDWIAALSAGGTRGTGSTAWDGAMAMAIAMAGVRALASGDWADVEPINP